MHWLLILPDIPAIIIYIHLQQSMVPIVGAKCPLHSPDQNNQIQISGFHVNEMFLPLYIFPGVWSFC